MTFSNPPATEGYADYTKVSLRAVAAGLGVPYEALTGDLSKFDFFSGRMGWLECQRSLATWQWAIFIPQFCGAVATWMIEALEVAGQDVTGVTVRWTPPGREMINPSDEVTSSRDAIRVGGKTILQWARERGEDPDPFLAEAKADFEKLDALGLIFDSDPRRVTAAGTPGCVSPTLVASPTAVGSPALYGGGRIPVAPARIKSGAAVPAPSVAAAMAGIITPAQDASGSIVRAPVVATGAGGTLVPAAIASSAAVGPPTVSGGARPAVLPSPIDSVAAVGAPAVARPRLARSPPRRSRRRRQSPRQTSAPPHPPRSRLLGSKARPALVRRRPRRRGPVSYPPRSSPARRRSDRPPFSRRHLPPATSGWVISRI